MKKAANIVDISLIVLIGLMLLLSSGCPLKKKGTGVLDGAPGKSPHPWR